MFNPTTQIDFVNNCRKPYTLAGMINDAEMAAQI